jgi:hypothetical protein
MHVTSIIQKGYTPSRFVRKSLQICSFEKKLPLLDKHVHIAQAPAACTASFIFIVARQMDQLAGRRRSICFSRHPAGNQYHKNVTSAVAVLLSNTMHYISSSVQQCSFSHSESDVCARGMEAFRLPLSLCIPEMFFRSPPSACGG